MGGTTESALQEFGDAFSDLGVGLSAGEIAALSAVAQTQVVDESEAEGATSAETSAGVEAAAELPADDVAKVEATAEELRQTAVEPEEVTKYAAEEGAAAELTAPSPDSLGGAAGAAEVGQSNKVAQLAGQCLLIYTPPQVECGGVGAEMPAPRAKSGGKTGAKRLQQKRHGAANGTEAATAEVARMQLTTSGTDLVQRPAVSQKELGRSSSITKGRGLRC